jgi:hypothetical protein
MKTAATIFFLVLAFIVIVEAYKHTDDETDNEI